jgi:hypothetical protein
MVIGAARVELHVHGSQSLKQKRGVVRSIAQRVRNRFQMAVAEVGGQDTWQLAELGLASVGQDARSVRARLEKAVEFIEELHLAEVVGQEVEVLVTPLADYGAEPDEDADEDEEPRQ